MFDPDDRRMWIVAGFLLLIWIVIVGLLLAAGVDSETDPMLLAFAAAVPLGVGGVVFSLWNSARRGQKRPPMEVVHESTSASTSTAVSLGVLGKTSEALSKTSEAEHVAVPSAMSSKELWKQVVSFCATKEVTRVQVNHPDGASIEYRPIRSFVGLTSGQSGVFRATLQYREVGGGQHLEFRYNEGINTIFNDSARTARRWHWTGFTSDLEKFLQQQATLGVDKQVLAEPMRQDSLGNENDQTTTPSPSVIAPVRPITHCPMCAEDVLIGSSKCQHCGYQSIES